MSSAAQMIRDRIEESGWRLQNLSQDGEVVREPRLSDAFNVPVWCFESNGNRISCDRPVKIEVHADKGGCIASCERLHVYASGRTVEECWADLHSQVVDFFESYTELSESDVSGLASRIRDLYVRHFSRIG